MSLLKRELTEAEKLQAIAYLKSLHPSSYVLQLYLAKPLPIIRQAPASVRSKS